MRYDWLGAATLTAVATVLGFQLFVPPIVGLANNGDFAKVTGLFDLDWPRADEFQFIVARYRIAASAHWNSDFLTAEALLAGAAVQLHRILSRGPVFDLRWMGFVHGGLFLAALGFLLLATCTVPPRIRAVTCALLVLMFSDALYATNFNSFYMDAGAVVFLALAITFYLRVRRSQKWPAWFGLLLSCVLLVTTKPQHGVLSLPIASLVAYLLWRAGSKRAAVLAPVAVLAAGGFSIQFGAPHYYSALNRFNVVFIRVVPASPDAARDLRELGLDESYRGYTGMYAYWPTAPTQNPEFTRQFARRTSYPRLAWYFAQRPAHAWQVLRSALDEAGRIRPPLGNFDRSAGRPPFMESNAFAFVSGLKRRLFEGHGTRYLCFFLGVTAILVAMSPDRAGALTLGAIGLLTMLIAGFGDAVDHARHFLLFHMLVDVMLVAAVASVGLTWVGPRRTPQNESGPKDASQARSAVAEESGHAGQKPM